MTFSIRCIGKIFATCLILLTASNAHAQATSSCALDSPAHRVALLELYTSEGCNSCPPADRWLSGLRQRGHAAHQVAALAFHVDYWDQLGWRDPYARAQFSDRQRALATRSASSVIYTPQLVLNGHDYRRGQRDQDFASLVAEMNAQPPGAVIRGQLRREGDLLHVAATVVVPEPRERDHAQAWIAWHENGLFTEVKAGENGGKRLHHDFVVRALAGPFSVGRAGTVQLEHSFQIERGWNPSRSGITVFIERSHNGQLLQAATREICG